MTLRLDALHWTQHKFTCTNCERICFASQEAIDWTRKADSHFEDDATDAEIASDFEFCLECATGVVYDGETVQ